MRLDQRAAPDTGADDVDGPTVGDGDEPCPQVRAAVERMLHLGWTRTRDEWEGWRAGLWKSNTHVADRILRDMP